MNTYVLSNILELMPCAFCLGLRFLVLQNESQINLIIR